MVFPYAQSIRILLAWLILAPKKVDYILTLIIPYKGEVWRELRKSLSPVFTSGKLKSMMEPMGEVSDLLVEEVAKQAKNSPNEELVLKKLFQGKNTA